LRNPIAIIDHSRSLWELEIVAAAESCVVSHLILPRYSPNIPIHLFRIIYTYSNYLFYGNLLQHASLAAVCMLKPMVRMSKKVLHTCTTAQGTLFSA
jgi:hypothetical protein